REAVTERRFLYARKEATREGVGAPKAATGARNSVSDTGPGRDCSGGGRGSAIQREGLPGWRTRNYLGTDLQPGCGDCSRTGPPAGKRREERKMTLHRRTMKVKRRDQSAFARLGERHELTWCEMARALT